jgi:hypothetical protein
MANYGEDPFTLNNVAMGGVMTEDPEDSSPFQSSYNASPWPPGTAPPGSSNAFDNNLPSPVSSPMRKGGGAAASSAFSSSSSNPYASPGPGNLDFYSGGSGGGMDAAADPAVHAYTGNVMKPGEFQRQDTMSGMQGLYDGFGSSGGGGAMGSMSSIDFSNEPPLLEELEINFAAIMGKTKLVLKPWGASVDPALLGDADLAGPVFFLLCLGFSLLLQGKVHFGVIYGFGVFGVVALYGLLNLLSPPSVGTIHFWSVMSTLGYCLLPIVAVAVVGIVVSLTGWLGTILALVAVAWCTITATRFFVAAFQMEKQRFLIAYPIGLLYSIFVLLAMF